MLPQSEQAQAYRTEHWWRNLSIIVVLKNINEHWEQVLGWLWIHQIYPECLCQSEDWAYFLELCFIVEYAFEATAGGINTTKLN